MNATLTLSTVGRHAEVADDGHRADLVAEGVSIEVAVRFSVRGCRGDSGADTDLLGVAVPDRLGVAAASLFLLDTGCAEAFAASVNDLNAALITWVANISFSFADNPPSASPFAFPRVLDFGARLPVVFLVAILVADAGLDSGMRSSRRVAVVADVQVVVEDTAAFTASALLVRDVMRLYTESSKHIVTTSKRECRICVDGAQRKKKKDGKRCCRANWRNLCPCLRVALCIWRGTWER